MAASACASVVLPTPGMSSISRWPRASRQASASRSGPSLPTTMPASCWRTVASRAGVATFCVAGRTVMGRSFLARGWGRPCRAGGPRRKVGPAVTSPRRRGFPASAGSTLAALCALVSTGERRVHSVQRLQGVRARRERRCPRGRPRIRPPTSRTFLRRAVPTAYITHPSFLLHEMGPYHPECPDRLTAISDRLIAAGVDPYLLHYTAPAVTREQVARVHSAAVHRRDRAGGARPRAALHRPGHRAQSAFADRRAPCGRRRGDGRRPRAFRRVPHGLLRRAPARPPRGAQAGHGLLPVQQHRGRGGARAGAPQARARGDRRLRRPPRQRHRGHLRRRRRAC